jgi:hypothetical protein
MILNKYKKNLFNKKNTIIFFFIFIVTNYVFFNYRIIFRENGYILGDWVINYSGGFVRRGLLGQIFFSISKYFDISIKHIIFFFSSAIYIISIHFFYKIIKNKLDNYLVLIFILLPSTFLFNFFDPLSVGRKEILIFFFFTFYYLNLEKILNNFKFKLFIILLFIIILLTHELIFFFIPYLFVLKYFHNNRGMTKFNPKDYYPEILIFLLASILILLIFNISHLHNNKVLCDSLLEVNLTSSTCWAINDFKSKIIINSLFSYFVEKKYFINYSFYILLSIFPLFLLVLQSSNQIHKKKKLFLSVFCLIFSTAFYMLVNDWGRYLNVTFLVHFLIILKFIEKDIKKEKIENKLIKNISLIFIFIYLTSWHMPHCCNPNLGTGYKDVYNRIIFRLNDNSIESTKFNDGPREFLRKLFNITQN